jgi:hypothetical protein
MRRIEFGRSLEEASRGVRGELLNTWSQVRILSPAPKSSVRLTVFACTEGPVNCRRPPLGSGPAAGGARTPKAGGCQCVSDLR